MIGKFKVEYEKNKFKFDLKFEKNQLYFNKSNYNIRLSKIIGQNRLSKITDRDRLIGKMSNLICVAIIVVWSSE